MLAETRELFDGHGEIPVELNRFAVVVFDERGFDVLPRAFQSGVDVRVEPNHRQGGLARIEGV